MALFYTEFLELVCSDIQAEKQWWISTFDCKETRLPEWDGPLPSDIALRLPGANAPTILLRDAADARLAQYEPSSHPLLFCPNLPKAHEHLSRRNLTAGPIQDSGGAQFFEVHDPEGHAIEICTEP